MASKHTVDVEQATEKAASLSAKWGIGGALEFAWRMWTAERGAERAFWCEVVDSIRDVRDSGMA